VPDGSGDGDPVDLGTGLFVLQKTDLFLPDTFPVALTRIYRNEDKISRSFGIGMSHPYALFPKWVRGFEEADVILPDGGRIRYTRVSGTGYETELEHTSTPTIFYKSRVKYNRPRAAWELTFKDGTVYVFGSGVPLQAIQDRNGNRVTILRTDANGNPSQKGNITHIRSPNGRWIAFTYDARNRVTQAVDNMGRVVTYTYDGNGRLSQVTDPNGGVTEYTYDASHRMLTIRDARGIVCLTNRVHFD
jgi:YD repeat-containing protein